MKPTPAEIDSGMSRSHSASDAAGQRQRHAGEDEQRVLDVPKVANSSSEDQQQRRPARRSAAARVAEMSCSNWPPHVDPVAGRELRPRASMRRCASATKEPRSRPRTLAVTTTRRLPFSRLIWFGPGAMAMRATAPSGMNDRAVVVTPGSVAAAGAQLECRFALVVWAAAIGQALERLEVGAQIFRQAHDEFEAPVAFEHFARRLAAEGDLDHLLHVGDVEAVARHRARGRCSTVSSGRPGDLLHLHVGRARDCPAARPRSPRPVSCKHVHVVAEQSSPPRRCARRRSAR